jgi:hypothetical protein
MQKFFLQFVIRTLYNMYILYTKLLFCVIFTAFWKIICLRFHSIMSVLLLFCFVYCCSCLILSAFICTLCIFTTYSASYCCHYKLKDPWNVCVCVHAHTCACMCGIQCTNLVIKHVKASLYYQTDIPMNCGYFISQEELHCKHFDELMYRKLRHIINTVKNNC